MRSWSQDAVVTSCMYDDPWGFHAIKNVLIPISTLTN